MKRLVVDPDGTRTIDDKAVRPSEFVALRLAESHALLAREGRPDGGA